MATTRSVAQSVTDLLDQLLDAGLALEVNGVTQTPKRVTWVDTVSGRPFLTHRGEATVEQYLHWLNSRAFSAVLPDGAILQISYDLDHGRVVGHRLGYIPCPYAIDTDLLDSGLALEDVVESYHSSGTTPVLLRSPLRFDYDPAAAKPGHPAAHMTINTTDCRIACIAPMHVLRFGDFVFRHFYHDQHRDHPEIFTAASTRHVGPSSLQDVDRDAPYLTWPLAAPAKSSTRIRTVKKTVGSPPRRTGPP